MTSGKKKKFLGLDTKSNNQTRKEKLINYALSWLTSAHQKTENKTSSHRIGENIHNSCISQRTYDQNKCT